jgi:ligand-binding sensor domain-containing protein
MRRIRFLLFLFLTLIAVPDFAQRLIPAGTWRVHASYQSIVDVDISGDQVIAASSTGVMVIDKQDGSLSTVTRMNGLHSSGITDITYNAPNDQIIVVFEDGTFDVTREMKSIETFDPSSTTVITGSKAINSVTIHNSFAYFSTDYGVLVFDLNLSEIKETWRDIGVDGETLPVYQSVFSGDSIFLATENGVIAGDLDDNLLDFNKWNRSKINGLTPTVNSIVSFDSDVFIAIENDGIYKYVNFDWEKQPFLAGIDITSITSSQEHLVAAVEAEVILIDTDNNVTTVEHEKLTGAAVAVEDEQGRLWVGDRASGLVSLFNNTAEVFAANGPSSSTGYRLRYHDKKIYMAEGGPTESFAPARNPGNISVFENGLWSIIDATVTDITDVEIASDGRQFYSSFGFGVKEKNGESEIIYDESNSSLINVNSPQRYVNVSSMLLHDGNLWVANYGVTSSLHKLTPQGNWEAFSFPLSTGKFPLDLEKDYAGKIWMRIKPEQGGGLYVFDPDTGESRYLTESDNNGELPSMNVYAIDEDRDGYVWIGTDRGAAYFFDSGSDVVRPIIGNIYLLLDDRVTTIETDGGNRKWMGTQRGAWLISPTGEESIHHFTTENSPLPSDIIVDIEIDHTTGEVFFLTDKGLVSYRGDATESSAQFSSVKIFPNPINADFSGTVGITGLATDALVKITDITGKMIWQSQANGGAISWNARTASGNRVANGIYLVFAASPSGTESIVGKVAVID